MFKHNFDKLLVGLSWSIRFKQCNFVKVQIANSLKIKSSKPKPKEPSSSIMFQDIVRVRVRFFVKFIKFDTYSSTTLKPTKKYLVIK